MRTPSPPQGVRRAKAALFRRNARCEAGSEGYTEKYRAVVDEGYLKDEPVGQRWDKVEPGHPVLQSSSSAIGGHANLHCPVTAHSPRAFILTRKPHGSTPQQLRDPSASLFCFSNVRYRPLVEPQAHPQ